MDKENLLKLLNDIKEDDMPSFDEGERILKSATIEPAEVPDTIRGITSDSPRASRTPIC
jgi:hypothetical protein